MLYLIFKPLIRKLNNLSLIESKGWWKPYSMRIDKWAVEGITNDYSSSNYVILTLVDRFVIAD